MKKLLLILLCVPMIGLGQTYNYVTIIDSNLNIYESPHFLEDSLIIIESFSKKDQELPWLRYSDWTVWKEGWIKVNYVRDSDFQIIEGWVLSSSVNVPFLHSKILEPITEEKINGEWTVSWELGTAYSVEGLVMASNNNHSFVKINGKFIKLEYKSQSKPPFFEFYAQDLSIKIFTYEANTPYYTTDYEGFMLINYKGIEEVIFIYIGGFQA